MEISTHQQEAILTLLGSNLTRIQIIKVIRNMSEGSLGLYEAKKMVDFVEEEKMPKFTVYFRNTIPLPGNYQPTLEEARFINLVGEGKVTVPMETKDALSAIFACFNDMQTEKLSVGYETRYRSMSVGDIVTLQQGEKVTTWVCYPVGFEPLAIYK